MGRKSRDGKGILSGKTGTIGFDARLPGRVPISFWDCCPVLLMIKGLVIINSTY